MSMTPENAVSWRDLVDQLTPEQIADLSDRESDPDSLVRLTGNASLGWTADALLDAARYRAASNLAVAMIGDVAPPPGATRVHEWDDADTTEPFRRVDFWSRVIKTAYEEITVHLRGLQSPDGRLDYEIRLPGETILTAGEARELAAGLVKAADEIDRPAAR